MKRIADPPVSPAAPHAAPALLAALLSCALAAPLPASTPQQVELPEAVSRVVGGDTARAIEMEFRVEGRGATAIGARSDLAFRIRVVVGAARASGVELGELRVGDPELLPILERRPAPPSRRPGRVPRVLGFSSWAYVTVQVSSPERLQLLVDAVTGAGGFLVGSEIGAGLPPSASADREGKPHRPEGRGVPGAP